MKILINILTSESFDLSDVDNIKSEKDKDSDEKPKKKKKRKDSKDD